MKVNSNIPSVDFFGLKISVFTKEELVKVIIDTIEVNQCKIIYGYSLAVLSYIKKYPSYLKITNEFDIMVTDGRVLYIIAKWFGYKLKYDISIPRLTILTIKLAALNHYRLMLLGGTSEVNLKAKRNLEADYPGILLCAGSRDGYFGKDELSEVINQVKENSPNILLLGFPTPGKQEFASIVKKELRGCIIIPCGGMIDVLAGKEKLTPLWIKKIGLASLYRHIQHPKRLIELFGIYIKTIKVLIVCFYLKKIKRSNNISIPEIVG